jgi:hypothetical protein
MTRHGDRRNNRTETECSEPQTLVTAGGNEVTASLSSYTRTVNERYCETCQEWHTVKGIMGVLMGCPTCGRNW